MSLLLPTCYVFLQWLSTLSDPHNLFIKYFERPLYSEESKPFSITRQGCCILLFIVIGHGFETVVSSCQRPQLLLSRPFSICAAEASVNRPFYVAPSSTGFSQHFPLPTPSARGGNGPRVHGQYPLLVSLSMPLCREFSALRLWSEGAFYSGPQLIQDRIFFLAF